MNTVDWLGRLIAFDTTSRLSNLHLIDAVAQYCLDLGLSPWRSFNADNSKANLFVTVPAFDGSMDGGTVLSGHTDVVPVDGQDWASEPFCAAIRDGKLYGRGACDMKGFIAAALNLLPQAVNAKLQRPLHLALSYDEEIGCLGAPVMLAQLAERGVSPAECIVGEPTSMQTVIAHKGIQVYSCTVHGHSAHSSLTPQGVNAIDYAARIIVFLQQLARDFQRQTTDAAFDVPYSTLNIGTIQGGTAVNIIPNRCEIQFDYRALPGCDSDALLLPLQGFIAELVAEMRQTHTDADIVLKQLVSAPAMAAQEDGRALYELIAALVGDAQQSKVAYATEGGQFQAAGMRSVICGPGSIEQAHKPDEYVTLEQLSRCDRFLQQLLQRMTQSRF